MQIYEIFQSHSYHSQKNFIPPQKSSAPQIIEYQINKSQGQKLLHFFIKFFSKSFGQFRNNA
jgi:hypothetical protein